MEIVEESGGNLAEFGKKNAIQIRIFLPQYMWAENKNEENVDRTVVSKM